jgi:hypothetical protein
MCNVIEIKISWFDPQEGTKHLVLRALGTCGPEVRADLSKLFQNQPSRIEG